MWATSFNVLSQACLKEIEEGIEVMSAEKLIGYLTPKEEKYLGELLKEK